MFARYGWCSHWRQLGPPCCVPLLAFARFRGAHGGPQHDSKKLTSSGLSSSNIIAQWVREARWFDKDNVVSLGTPEPPWPTLQRSLHFSTQCMVFTQQSRSGFLCRALRVGLELSTVIEPYSTLVVPQRSIRSLCCDAAARSSSQSRAACSWYYLILVPKKTK